MINHKENKTRLLKGKLDEELTVGISTETTQQEKVKTLFLFFDKHNVSDQAVDKNKYYTEKFHIISTGTLGII